MFPSNTDVRVYVDGFNVYFSMKDKDWKKYYWLDIWRFSIKLLQKAKSMKYIQDEARIESVRYFTSRISGAGRNKEKAKRQHHYLEALEENCRQNKSSFTISYGQYQFKPYTCNHCYKNGSYPIEKMTDVNLATDLLVDAFFDKFGTAIVVSGDSDLKSPVQSVGDLFGDKNVIVAMPPGRWSVELASSCFKYLMIEERLFRQSQLPEQLRRRDDYAIKKPSLWA